MVEPMTPPGAARLPLPNGLSFIVDAADADAVAGFSWHTKGHSRGDKRGTYVHRTVRLTPGRKGKKTAIALHRWLVGAQPGQVVDHINGDTLDNRRQNLRLTDARGNSTNIVSSKRQKLGGFKGVSWNPRAKKWQASICGGEIKSNGKRRQLYLGVFTDPVIAAKAYDAAALRHFGEFACLNFPLGTVETTSAETANAAEKESA